MAQQQSESRRTRMMLELATARHFSLFGPHLTAHAPKCSHVITVTVIYTVLVPAYTALLFYRGGPR